MDDALSPILRSLRLSSGLISRGRFTAPWGVHAQPQSGAIFHAVIEGSCRAQRDGDAESIDLAAGEMVIFTRGEGHTISDPQGSAVVEISTLPRNQRGGLAQVEHGGDGEATRILCGRFSLDHAATTLEDLLPPVIAVRRPEKRIVEWLDTTLQLIGTELDQRTLGSEEMLTRLTDLLFVQALRSYALSLKAGDGGWLGAVHDPRIAQAIALLHQAPADPWTAATLARRVGMSRSAFFVRFNELIGESPSRYLTRWRMRVATDLMQRQALSTAELAERVGYSSEDAFSRAFRRTLGKTPSAWRREL